MPFVSGNGQQINAIGTDAYLGPAISGTVSGGPGLLRIKPEDVDGAIAVFKGALETIRDEVRRAAMEIRARPPANDEVSQDAANAFNRIGTENANSAIAAWSGAVAQLSSIVEQLEASKRTIMNADAINADKLGPPG